MFEALGAGIIVALLSLAGVFMFGNQGKAASTHHFILPLAVGIFLGIVFFELIPETLELGGVWGSVVIATGFLAFYLLSHILNTYHHHHGDHDDGCNENGAVMLLLGDAIHNTADGVVIASAFMVNPMLGIITTAGVALHEIPQEIAEFGVLLRAGYSSRKAALLNLLSATTIIFGVLLTVLFTSFFEDGLWILTGLAAGNLLYIASTDLLPELQESHRGHFYQSFLFTLLGLGGIALLFFITHT
jgi:zinc and cadmium transporter